MPRLRDLLRTAVSALSAHCDEVTASAVIERVRRVDVAPGGSALTSYAVPVMRLSCELEGRSIGVVSNQIDASGVRRAMDTLRARGGARARAGRRPPALEEPRARVLRPSDDPAALSPAEWAERAEAFYERARAVTGSRIVHQAAFALCNDEERVFLGRGRDRSQRIVRTRAGAIFAGHEVRRRRGAGDDALAALRAELVDSGGIASLDELLPGEEALAAAAERALTLFAPVAPPRGEFDIVLAPSLVARLIHDCVAPALDAALWRDGLSAAAALGGAAVAAPAITLIDDPSAAGGYGSYAFDDEGAAAAATALIDAGVLRAPLTDHASARALGLPNTANARCSQGSAVPAPRPSNLVLRPGTRSLGALIAEIDHGFLLDGCMFAQVEPRTWRVRLRAARAYEIRRGKRTGAVYPDIDIAGSVPALLGAARAVSSEAERFCYGGGAYLASSALAPFLATRAPLVGP
ncbi:peptidase U62 modulator of DNA gyrase [Haliangium ochraceum DSM 14365]|uniref:Peptidase U62 modulator of DNA gyrase n=2 Tax=Haliangium ochraceum TaxID=80816 RepID=D0LZB1_HALO1|nr:peptidase U62 modulator of DNA gyrase [Haliangium ochraceum DSM 14365]